MEFRLLGSIEAEVSGRSIPLGPPRQLGILAVLAADAGRLVLMDTLVDRVWGDAPPARARDSLYAYVARLRRILAGDSAVLVRRSRGYLLDVDPDSVDVHRFRSLVAQARQPDRDVRTRAELLRDALALWRGTPLAGMSGEWADAVRQAWQQQRVDAVVAWAEAELSVSGPAAVIDTVTGLLIQHPLHEPLAGVLMRAMHAAGRTGAALDVYARLRTELAAQLGIDPSAPLQRAHEELLRPDAAVPVVSQDPRSEVVVTALYDRDVQLSTLRRLAAAAVAGRGSVVLVRGPAGIGKTALLDAWAAAQSAEGMRVMRATAGEAERDTAFAVVHQLLASNVEPLPETSQGLYQLVVRACENGPLALVVDDAQWADAPSLRWFDYLARRIGGLPLLLVMASRPVGAPHLTGQVITLPELSPTAMSAWVRRELPDAAEEFRTACAEAAGGDPSLLTELLQALHEHGVESTAEQAHRVAEFADGLLAAAAVRRLSTQDDATRGLAQALVLLGDDTEWPLAAALSGLSDAEGRDHAGRLTRIGVVAPGDPARFRHVSIRSMLAETEMPPAELAVWHARAAELLHADNAPPERVAAHLLLADPGPGHWRVEALRAAARAARERGLPDTAASYLRRALREPASTTQRGDLTLELGGDEVLSDPDAAARRLALALPGVADPLSQGRVASLLGDALFAAFRHEQAVEVLDRAVAELTPLAGSDGLVREQWWRLQAQLVLIGYERPATIAAARAAADRLRALGVAGDTPGERAALLALATPAMMGEGDAATVNDLLDRGLRGELASEARATHVLGTAGLGYLLTDRLDDAALRFDQLRDLAGRYGATAARAYALAGAANVEWRRGLRIPLAQGFDASIRANLRARLALVPIAIEAQVELGDLDAAAAILAEHLTGPIDESVRWGPVVISATRVQAERGDPGGALALLLAYGAQEEHAGLGTPSTGPWRTRAARIAATLGQHAQAKELATAAVDAAYRWGTARVIGAGLRCLGAVTGGAEGRALLAEAVSVLQASPARLELAWATYEWGLAVRQAGDLGTGLEILGDALKLAELRGARLLAGRVRAELVAAGVRL
ncbi:MAG TPA: BTAD domain-containing putative transcriptional regulator [Kutzneria sp.]|nr:BTAD domain-containing putative transcriptional regulator [Kutzneria sp.]